MFAQKKLSLAKSSAEQQSQFIVNRLKTNLNPAYHKVQILTKKHPIALLIWVHLLQDQRNPQRYYLCNDQKGDVNNFWSRNSQLGGMSNETIINSPTVILQNSSFIDQEIYGDDGKKRIKLCLFRLQWKSSSLTQGFDTKHQPIVRIIKEGWHVTHFSRTKLKSQELVLKIAETQAEQALEEALLSFPISETLLMPLTEFASLCNTFFDDSVEKFIKKEINKPQNKKKFGKIMSTLMKPLSLFIL